MRPVLSLVAVCVACGKGFAPRNRRGPPKKTCSAECRQKHYNAEAIRRRKLREAGVKRLCVVCGEPAKSKFRYCSKRCAYEAQRRRKGDREGRAIPRRPPRMVEGEFVCKLCGKSFKPRARKYGTYCSRACAYDARASAPSTRVYLNACKECGKRWYWKCPKARCSRACDKRCANRIGRERWLAGHPVREWVCVECGAPFVPHNNRRRLHCSRRCSTRHWRRDHPHSQAARARHFGVAREVVSPLRVFERDGWRCQICGRATPKRWRGTLHRRAPELDHRIPMSLGGPHTYANVQCACRECNGRKGNQSTTGQLPLWSAPPPRAA